MLCECSAERFATASSDYIDASECLSAYVATPYASSRVAYSGPPIVGMRFGVKCPEANFDWGLKTLAVTSMISWRGEWYVVHLNGFE
jgi:hypothetical protein